MRRCKVMVLLLGATFAFLPVISSAQMIWTCATDSADWSRRSGHASVVFDGKMWVMGGRLDPSSDSLLNDVWWSTDGTDWTLATDSAPWSRRMGHEVVVFQDTMWLMGGWGVDTVMSNDVWYSTDGANWTCITDSAPWDARSFYGAIVYNDEIWIMGGVSSTIYLYDVWSSPDGINWTCVDTAADWSWRCNHKVSNFDGKMWVVAGHGGFHLNDVWYSTDGSSWICAINTAQWSARRAHTIIVFDNKMWMIGGLSGPITSTFYLNDVWYSTDGANWYCADSAADWLPRAWHTSVVYNNNMWVIGGARGTPGRVNDVWYSSGPGIEEDNISIAEEHYLGSTIVKGPLQLPEDKKCKVFDLTGRVVESDKIRPGIYFIQVDGVVTQKVIKIR